MDVGLPGRFGAALLEVHNTTGGELIVERNTLHQVNNERVMILRADGAVRVQDNTVTTSSTSSSDAAIDVSISGDDDLLISGNTVTAVGQAQGILVDNDSTSGLYTVTLSNNTVESENGDAILLENSAGNANLCAEITGNTVTANGGGNAVFAETDIRVANGDDLETLNTINNGAAVVNRPLAGNCP